MVIGVGDPTELDPDLVYEAVAAALAATTELVNVDDLGDTATPGALLHRSFRYETGDILSTPPSRAAPGDIIMVTERIAVVLSHDLDPNARRSSLRLAAHDFRSALVALLTRTEISGLAQPLFRGCTRRQVGTRYEHKINLDLQYEYTLPEATGPE